MRIFIAKNRVRHGPFRLAELNGKIAHGEFGAHDLASIEGAAWVKVSEVPGIVLTAKGDQAEAVQKEEQRPQSSSVSKLSHSTKPFGEVSRTKAYPITFGGNGSEFFNIWIVNLLLTICTLGIYSAWAKVRTLNYFYGNTTLDGASFSFVANPISILKGRLLVFAFFIAYSLLQTAYPLYSLLLMFAVLPLVPLLIVRAMRFRMQNTQYRGLRFDFAGSVGQSYAIYLGGLILTYVSFGILYPWWECQKKQFLMGHIKFGTAQSESYPRAGEFYKYFGICIVMSIALFLLLFVFIFIASSAGAGIFSLLGPVLFYLGLAVVAAYWYANTTNHVMGVTKIEKVSFSSKMESGYLISLWIGNVFLLAVTLGLATPWVMVRNARYRISRTQVYAPSLQTFVADQNEKSSAIGEELGEALELDLGL